MPSQAYNIKTISIVGLGTLGSEIAKQLARCNYNLKLIDFDEVESRNIKIQALYNKADIGKQKAEVAEKRLKKINKIISIQSFPEKLTSKNTAILKADLVIDCTDNLTARFLMSDFCYNRIPLLHTAAFKDLATFYLMLPNNPCLNCIYASNIDINGCRQSNINPLTAARMADLAIKQIKNLPHNQQEEKLLRLNIKNNTIEKIKISRSCKRCLKSL